MPLLFILAAALYLAASVMFYLDLLGRQKLRAARLLLGAAAAAHLALIGSYCVQHANPLADLKGALSFTGWLLTAGYLLATFRRGMGSMGAFIAPMALALVVASQITPGGASGAQGALGKLHIAMVAMGSSALGLAAVVAVVYLFQATALKKKRIGGISRRWPPLTALDETGRILILAGFPLFTIAQISGVLWMIRRGQTSFNPEYAVAVTSWLIFAFLIVARWSIGWRGRSAAWATVVGFAAVVVVMGIYLARRLWG